MDKAQSKPVLRSAFYAASLDHGSQVFGAVAPFVEPRHLPLSGKVGLLSGPFLELLTPADKAAQYVHLGYFHLAELNARLMRKEVK